MKEQSLTVEEIHHLRRFLEFAGIREKRDVPLRLQDTRTVEMKILGKVLKKLRKAELTAE